LKNDDALSPVTLNIAFGCTSKYDFSIRDLGGTGIKENTSYCLSLCLWGKNIYPLYKAAGVEYKWAGKQRTACDRQQNPR